MRNENEVPMYAILISTDEIYWKCVMGKDPEAKDTIGKWVKNVHPDPMGRFQAFLYPTPDDRMTAWPHIKKAFPSATIAVQTAYVDKRYVKEGGDRK